MRMKLIALAGAGLLLAGCSASSESIVEKCGGETAGIVLNGETIEYSQENDTTRTAWTCLLNETIPDSTDQYVITQGLTPGEAGDTEANGWKIVYGMSPESHIRLFFNP